MKLKRLYRHGFLSLFCLLLCCSLGLTACTNDVDQEAVSQSQTESEATNPFGYGVNYVTINGISYPAEEYNYSTLKHEQESVENPPVYRIPNFELDDEQILRYREENAIFVCYPSSNEYTTADLPQHDEWISLPGGNCLLEVPLSVGIAKELPRDYIMQVGETEYRTYDLQDIYVREGHPTLAD